MSDKYKLHNENFDLTEESWCSLEEDAMHYLYSEVIPQYTDVITEDPLTGLIFAVTDFLRNDSPLQDKSGEYLSYDELLKLGNQFCKADEPILKGKKVSDPLKGMPVIL